MRNLVRSRRGVTPVLSSLLLTVIAVAGMSTAVTATYVITDQLHDIMGERLIIEDVWFRDGEVLVYLRNVGKISVTVDAVYINRVAQPFASVELEQGKHGWVTIPYYWSANSAYEIKVATRRGTIVEDYYMSPA